MMMPRNLTKLAAAAATALAVTAGAALGQGHCPASNIIGSGIISNVCWSCIFPLRISGITIFGSPQAASGTDANGFSMSSRPRVPDEAANSAVCVCNDGALPTIGVPIGMWLPTELYETTMTPGCSSVLGGVQIGIADPLYLGSSGDPTSDLEQQSFNHVHTYSFPIVLMMELFTKCASSYSDIDILYLSEIDPMWNDPIVAMYGNPMSVFGSSIMAQAACAADSISSSVGRPIDDLFWCGGSWTTTMAPYTGFEHAQGPVQFSSSTAQKLLAMNAARGIERSHVGNEALCQAQYQPMLKRSHYRWQAAWPRAEGTRNHASGESILRWGAGRTIPGVAEMPIYLRWNWTDCCATVSGG
ncbi:TraU family protein [Paracoccus sp. C2R09]|uniref:TraU family protein n=2 Tax=unclassified Paracoccus (in: a-proteobacteria) TaxID=2688777 RepID=UPI001C09C9E5|nr:TraU family protein [Paracoccus sp. C2R09]MBU2959145.1 TraU family protein [Paracoccus sp. C2R09]